MSVDAHMKKILIVNAQLPFVYGGAEYVADRLKNKLCEFGHRADIVRIPFKWYPSERIPDHILAARLLDLTQASGEDVDLVIGLKFPAYYIRHPNKVLWVLHQFRQVYDLWGTPYQDFQATQEGLAIKDIVIHSDNTFLREAKKTYAISKVVAKRMRDFNGIDATPLYPPVDEADLYHDERCGDYLFFPSRLNMIKRQELAMLSMKYVKTGARLVIAGKPDSTQYASYLQGVIKKNGLGGKVDLVFDMTEAQKISCFANALGCLFVPYGEDYGYVTLESFYSKKPVITCADSGGPCDFVEDGINGYVVPPEPEAIAQAIDGLYSDKKGAVRLGKAGYDKLKALDITWDKVIRSLVA